MPNASTTPPSVDPLVRPFPAGGSCRIVVAANPISGRGRGVAVAESTAAALTAAGHRPQIVPTQLGPSADWLDPTLREADLLVVVGGDGAMRMAAAAAIRCGTPVHHLPLGTENLFAREFGSRPDPEQLIERLAAGVVRRVDVGTAGDETFLLMASIGFDAEVVHDLAARRRGAITHWSYAGPILRRAVRWRAPRVSIDVDGVSVARGVRGSAIVANCRQYGGRLDPLPNAEMDDGALGVVLLPARGAFGAARGAAACRMRRSHRLRGAIIARGQRIRVACDPPSRLQLDGDPAGDAESRVAELACTVCPGVLPVLAGARPAVPAVR
ncbi:MAG: diacylglycerol kinase family protein [Phycisphaerales bacterium]